jgi:hypothetical protein
MISVIVPAYNAAQTLRTTLSSLSAQDVPFELIVIDDGSTDGTRQLCEEEFPSAIIISQPNAGVSAARNRGLALAKYDLVQFVDADDVLAVNTLSERVRALMMRGGDVAVTDYAEFSRDEDLIAGHVEPKTPSWSKMNELGGALACATSFWAPPAAILYRKAAVLAVGGFRENLKILQDARLLFDVAQKGGRFVRLDGLGAYYRITSTSLSRRDEGRFWVEVMENGAEIEQTWRALGPLTNPQRAGLQEIYNGAAAALFRCGRLEFGRALEHMERLGLEPTSKVSVMRLATNVVGLRAAFHLYSAYRTFNGDPSYRAVQHGDGRTNAISTRA